MLILIATCDERDVKKENGIHTKALEFSRQKQKEEDHDEKMG